MDEPMIPMPTNIDWMAELRGILVVLSVLILMVVLWMIEDTNWNDDE